MGDPSDVVVGTEQRRCALLSRSLEEPLAATAPPQGGAWIAVEHVGPWPGRGKLKTVLPPEVGEVFDRADALRVRTQLIRRPGRRRAAQPPYTVLLASNRNGRPWLEEAALDDLRALADLDLDAVAKGLRPGFGRPTEARVLLVCTHGRRDVCCAQHGRPAAATIAETHPGRVWETTHLAGDRFAANVACLPEGTYHGRVTRRTALDVAAACLAGRVHLAHYRGQAGVPAPAQAAEHAVRLLTGLTRLDAVTAETGPSPAPAPTDTDDHADTDGAEVVVQAADGRRFVVPVRRITAPGPPRPTSCSSCVESVPTSYQAAAPRELAAEALPAQRRSG